MNKAGDWLHKCLTTMGPYESSLTVLVILDALEGEWKEEGDTQDITWGYFRSIMDAQLYARTLERWKIV